MLDKINSLGINNKWLKSYLNKRKQVVIANGITSKEGTITCGVPQGSTLGPLLFLIYINDINKNFINSKIKLFANDTLLYTSSSSPNVAKNQLQIDLNTLDLCCKQHKLSINTSKTKSILFGIKKFNNRITCTNFSIAGDEINFLSEYKYLGIVVEQTLSFSKHIKYIHSLTAHKIYMLSKIRSCINQVRAIRIYNTKILPYFDQGDILYLDACIKDVGKLQKLQNRALRICLNTNNRYHTLNLHHNTKIPLLCDRRNYHLSVHAFTRTKNAEYLDTLPITTRRRNAPLLKIFKSNYKVVDRSVYLQTATLWNNMDVDTRNFDNLEAFKLVQKNKLIDSIPPLVN